MATMPHCDSRVLHAPGECEYCDKYPEWQRAREMWGIAFTGHRPEDGELPCPSEVQRDLDTINAWHGNRPSPLVPASPSTPTITFHEGQSIEDWWSAHSPTQLGRPNIPVLRADLEAMIREIVQDVLREQNQQQKQNRGH